MIDLARGFMQVPQRVADRTLFGFKLHNQYYQLPRHPFGFFNSIQVFNTTLTLTVKEANQLMRQKGLPPTYFIMHYVDDILVAANSEREHFLTLGCLLEILEKHRWNINNKKAQWMQTKVEYLGTKLRLDTIEPFDGLITKIQQLETLACKQDLRELIRFYIQLLNWKSNQHFILSPLMPY